MEGVVNAVQPKKKSSSQGFARRSRKPLLCCDAQKRSRRRYRADDRTCEFRRFVQNAKRHAVRFLVLSTCEEEASRDRHRFVQCYLS